MKFTESHEWIKIEGESGFGIVGITNRAQEALGDIVFVELPEVGREVQKGKQVVVVESTKAAADVYSPVSGQIVVVNGSLEAAPENVNKFPETTGWLFKIKLNDVREMDGLMDVEASL